MKSVMTTIRLPKHLHEMLQENNLCLTEMVVEMLKETEAKIQREAEGTSPTPDERVDAALEDLNGDHDLRTYLSSSGRIHRKIVAFAYARVGQDACVILTTKQKERIRTFLENQLLEVRDEVETRHPALDEVTEKRFKNYIVNMGYRYRLEAEGKTPELMQEIGERFILNSGPVTPTSLESIIEHLRSKY
ncbi:MAG: hypothetical protein PHG93_06155 [Candidatus Methanomethylophilaceae archaeon]|nr:hypothetical protein [Candidatus Methanomethylophilaceae archaeon]